LRGSDINDSRAKSGGSILQTPPARDRDAASSTAICSEQNRLRDCRQRKGASDKRHQTRSRKAVFNPSHFSPPLSGENYVLLVFVNQEQKDNIL
jgi:hypothetical protein